MYELFRFNFTYRLCFFQCSATHCTIAIITTLKWKVNKKIVSLIIELLLDMLQIYVILNYIYGANILFLCDT